MPSLEAAVDGEGSAAAGVAADYLPRFYAELRRLARSRLARAVAIRWFAALTP
jgi:hypothetical protein